MLLARGGRCDAIDATVACSAAGGDDILTSGPGGLRALAEAGGIHVGLIPSETPGRPIRTVVWQGRSSAVRARRWRLSRRGRGAGASKISGANEDIRSGKCPRPRQHVSWRGRLTRPLMHVERIVLRPQATNCEQDRPSCDHFGGLPVMAAHGAVPCECQARPALVIRAGAVCSPRIQVRDRVGLTRMCVRDERSG
jgi:hypothetical protein